MADSGDDERLLLLLLLFIFIWQRCLQRNQGEGIDPYPAIKISHIVVFPISLIIPHPIPILFTLFSLDQKRQKQKWNRKKKKLFWSFWLQFRQASCSASNSDFRFTLDRNVPCTSDSNSASDSDFLFTLARNVPCTFYSDSTSDSVAIVNQP